MARFNKEKAMKLVEDGDMEQISALFDDIEERLNSRPYGLLFERGGDGEDSFFDTENVVSDWSSKLPIPLLRKDLSLNEDTANGNMLLEGDNFIWLNLLAQTHAGKCKVLLADVPYNTGAQNGEGGLKYNDKFIRKDDIFKHSMWLSFMETRFRVAKHLMADDGVIFINVDDREVWPFKLLLDDIFGEDAFVAAFIWRKRTAKSDVPFGVSGDTEYVLCYANPGFKASIKKETRKYFETDDYPGRPWRYHDLTKQTSAEQRPNSFFTMVDPKTGAEYPADPNRTWAVSKDTFQDYYDQGRIIFPGDYDFLKIKKPVFRYWKEDDIAKAGDSFGRVAVSNILPTDVVGMTKEGTSAIKDIFGSKEFEFPKPPQLIKYLVQIATGTQKDALIIDFFAGSGTAAQAVEELNQEDEGHRHWIMINNNEDVNDDDGDPETGICRDITKPRIDTVITGIRPDGSKYSDGIDSGYQYFQYDFMPRYESREANQRAFFTPTKNIDALVRIKYGVVLKDLDRDRMAMTYESNTRQIVVFIKDIDRELVGKFFDDEHEHIIIANDTIDIAGVESVTIHSLIPSYEFFL